MVQEATLAGNFTWSGTSLSVHRRGCGAPARPGSALVMSLLSPTQIQEQEFSRCVFS